LVDSDPVARLRFLLAARAPPPHLVEAALRVRIGDLRRRDDTDRGTPLTVPSRVFGTDPLGR
jgi:hypothetical protein